MHYTNAAEVHRCTPLQASFKAQTYNAVFACCLIYSGSRLRNELYIRQPTLSYTDRQFSLHATPYLISFIVFIRDIQDRYDQLFTILLYTYPAAFVNNILDSNSDFFLKRKRSPVCRMISLNYFSLIWELVLTINDSSI